MTTYTYHIRCKRINEDGEFVPHWIGDYANIDTALAVYAATKSLLNEMLLADPVMEERTHTGTCVQTIDITSDLIWSDDGLDIYYPAHLLRLYGEPKHGGRYYVEDWRESESDSRRANGELVRKAIDAPRIADFPFGGYWLYVKEPSGNIYAEHYIDGEDYND